MLPRIRHDKTWSTARLCRICCGLKEFEESGKQLRMPFGWHYSAGHSLVVLMSVSVLDIFHGEQSSVPKQGGSVFSPPR